MDKYDYITATIEEEKERLEKVIGYLKDNNNYEELTACQERYNNVLKYLNAKDKYLAILDNIKKDKEKLESLLVTKEEYAVDNILLEDTLLSKFNEDTNNRYKNLLYEDIRYQSDDIRDILYLLFEKETEYSSLVTKRNKLKGILNKERYPKSYNTIISQDILIEKQNSILDEIFIIENNIKVEESKLKIIANTVMTDGILKLLYEFWIIDSYDPKRVNKEKLFMDNRSLINIKNSIACLDKEERNNDKEDILFTNLNLPGINEDTVINIDGKDYIS